MKNLNSLFILCLLSIFVSSCIPTTYSVSTQNLDELPYTVEPTKISSHTPLPLVSTATSFATATLTPLPTLTTQEAEQIIAKMMNDNGNCKEPCFWGITLERTDIWDAVRWLDSLTRSFGYKGIAENTKGSKINYNTSFTLKKDLDILINLWVEDARISSIETQLFGLSSKNIENKDWLAFRPDEMLRINGIPNHILFGLILGPEGNTKYVISYLYDGMYIEYLSSVFPWGETSCFCPLRIREFDSIYYVVNENYTFETQGFDNLEDITTLSKEQFTNLLTSTTQSACFEIDYLAIFRDNLDTMPYLGNPSGCDE